MTAVNTLAVLPHPIPYNGNSGANKQGRMIIGRLVDYMLGEPL